MRGQKKKRVLHFKYALKTDGATQVLLDLCEHMDPSRVTCDFLLGDQELAEQVRERIRKIWPEGRAGGRVYPIAAYCQEKGRIAYTLHKIVFCCRLMRRGRYDVVHVHTEDAGRSLILLFAWLMGVKGRVVHSHNSGTQSGRLGEVRQAFFRQLLPVWANGYLACSAQAARWMFPGRLLRTERVVFLPNGIRVEQFGFSEKERQRCRQELGLTGRQMFVLCAVGRLARQKNLAFLFQVLQAVEEGRWRGRQLQSKEQERSGPRAWTGKMDHGPTDEPMFRLLIVGDGPEEERLKRKARAMGLSRQVLFLGERADVPRILWASDLFLLPSFFEGLPRALVEAQAAGLPCIVSDRITRQADLTGKVCYLPVKGAAERWAKKIAEEAESQLGLMENAGQAQVQIHQEEDARQQRVPLRGQAALKVEQAGFAIGDVAKRLERYYDCF